MTVDSALVGLTSSASTVAVERGRLRFFAKAIGETNPAYTDLTAAKEAGYPDLPVPPTFLFCLEMDRPDPFSFLTEAGIELSQVLHGEQSFTYTGMAYAGDELTFESRIADTYQKKGGALTFLIRETQVTRAGEPIALLTNVIVVRVPEAEA